MILSRLPFFLTVLGVLTLSACTKVYTYQESLAVYPKPPVVPETLPPQLDNPATTFWRAGFWAPSTNNSFVWVPGVVLKKPYPSAVWEPGRWVRHLYGWTFTPGHWS